MDVDHDLAAVALCPTSVDAQKGCESNTSKDQHTPGNKKIKTRQIYNRDNVKIEEFIHKDPGEINAKQLRVLLPAMLQKISYPEKDVTKTKIKGLWEHSNKPADYPTGLPFKDPNNAQKMPLEKMRQMYAFLKNKLLKTQNPVEQGHSDNQLKPQMPTTHGFQIQSENHDVSVNHDKKQAFPVVQQDVDDSNRPIQEQAVAECVIWETDYELLQQADYIVNTMVGQDTVTDDNGTQLTGPLVLTRNDAVENDQAMTCAVMPESVDTTGQARRLQTDTTGQAGEVLTECQKCVSDALSILEEPNGEFQNVFGGNGGVMDMRTKVFTDILTPLSDAAFTGDKSACSKLVELVSSLWSIMKRYTFEGPQSDPSRELAKLYEDYCMVQVISEDVMLPVDHEVQINSAVVMDEPSYGGMVQEPHVQTQDSMETNFSVKQLEVEFTENNSNFMSTLRINQHGMYPLTDQEFDGFTIGFSNHSECGDTGQPRTTAQYFTDGINRQMESRCTDACSRQYAKLMSYGEDLHNKPCMQVNNKEEQELTNDIIDMETDYFPSAWEMPSQNNTVMDVPVSNPGKNIPLIVSEVAEMSDDDTPCQKRKRRTAKKDVDCKPCSSFGEKQIQH